MPDLTVVVPTLNERENVMPLVAALDRTLAGVNYEIVFVDDDSADETASTVRELAQRNPRIRVLHRIGRRGLASAAVEGMLASSAPYLAVIDGDMQHDERILPAMLEKLQREHLDIVVGTRHVAGGSMGEMPRHRVALSRLGQRLSALVCRAEVTDPMSGFFVLSRAFLDEVVRSLSATGFKVLLDLIASSPRPVRAGEVGYTFRPRLHGASKLDLVVSLEYLQLLAEKLVGDWIPVSYVIFGCVGAIGVVAQLGLVQLCRTLLALPLDASQLAASALVIGLNFVLNNQWTFRGSRLRGGRFLLGMASFYVACSIGLFLNYSVFTFLRAVPSPWYIAVMAGIIVGSVWNYWISSLFVWQIRRRRMRRPIGLMRAARHTAGNGGAL